MKPKDHFYISRTGAIFVLTKFNENWYLAGSPLLAESQILWPVGIATHFREISNYIKNQLGFFELR
jgi:hypothetical protein